MSNTLKKYNPDEDIGHMAKLMGLKKSDNPFKRNTKQARSWTKGWNREK